MSKNCIRCKRELAKSQKSCLACGSSQNYISHFRNTALVFLLTFSLLGYAGYKFFDAEGKLKEIERLRIVEQESDVSISKITLLEERLEQKDAVIQTLKVDLSASEENVSQNSLSQNESNLAIKKSQTQANDANKRASWLSKENRRFKQEISELTVKVQQLEKVNAELATAKQIPQPLPVESKQIVPAESETNEESEITPS